MQEEMDFSEGPPIDDITVSGFDNLVAEYASIRREKDGVEEILKTVNARLTGVERRILGFMRHYNKDKYPVKDVGMISVRKNFTVRVPDSPEKKEAFFGYLKELNCFEDMVSVHSRTLNSFYKEQMESAKGNPNFKIPGLDEPTYSETLVLRKD